MFFLKVIEDESQHIFLEKYSGILSSSLIIILFIIERIISARESRKERSVNWYSGVVVQPNLKVINDFFINYTEELKRIYENKINLLSFSPEQKTLIKAKEYNKLQLLTKDFEFDFLILVIRYDLNLYNRLTYEIVGEMNDYIIPKLDQEHFENDIEILLTQVKSSKSQFFSELYETIR